MKERGPIYHKSKEFALKTIELCRWLQEHGERIISNQLFRAATAVGSNYREGLGAESTNDFIHKISVSVKETLEAQYWLELLLEGGYINQNQYTSLYNLSDEVIRMMTSSILTLKGKMTASAT